MALTKPGAGSDYGIAGLDVNHEAPDGAKTYKLHLPPSVPVKDFWAVTIYDTQTRCELQTDQRLPTVGSQSDGFVKNDGRLVRRLLRTGSTEGQGSQLVPDHPRQVLVHHPSDVRADRGLDRQDLAPRRDRAGRVDQAVVYPNRRWESPYVTNNSTFYEGDYRTSRRAPSCISPPTASRRRWRPRCPRARGPGIRRRIRTATATSSTANKTYKVTVPPKVPVAVFWAVTVYDPWNRCELKSQPYPSISSQQDPPPVTNDDGSVDIYFATDTPDGVPKQNVVKTLPDQGFFVYFRYYSRSTPSTTRRGCRMTWRWSGSGASQHDEGRTTTAPTTSTSRLRH